jgi:molecular chaperone DnaJ
MDAAFGVETEITVEKQEKCPVCDGTGCERGTSYETCPVCRGSGQIVRSQGFFSIRTPCPNCRGEGQSIPHPCQDCNGTGRVLNKKVVMVKIPAGVDTGSRLRLTGEGESGLKGGPPGNLYVIIHVRPHDFFKRDGTNIICEIPISFVDAALGTKVEVPTLQGKVTLHIPKGTQPGELFRFKGQGLPSLRGYAKGDQIIQLHIKTPTNLSRKQESLLKEFAQLESKKFAHKIKKFFH